MIQYFLKNISFSENCLQQNLCFVANCPSSIVLFLKCSLKRFWQGVKQDYCDSVSSSWERFLKCSLKRFWQGVKPDYYDSVSSSWERFLEGCKTGSLCYAMGASDPGQNQANKK